MYHIPSHGFLGCSSVNTGNMTGGRVVKIVLSSFNMIRNAGVVVGEGVTLFLWFLWFSCCGESLFNSRSFTKEFSSAGPDASIWFWCLSHLLAFQWQAPLSISFQLSVSGTNNLRHWVSFAGFAGKVLLQTFSFKCPDRSKENAQEKHFQRVFYSD